MVALVVKQKITQLLGCHSYVRAHTQRKQAFSRDSHVSPLVNLSPLATSDRFWLIGPQSINAHTNTWKYWHKVLLAQRCHQHYNHDDVLLFCDKLKYCVYNIGMRSLLSLLPFYPCSHVSVEWEEKWIYCNFLRHFIHFLISFIITFIFPGALNKYNL